MSKLLIEMVVVLLTALVCGWVARRMGQSRVVGEIAGGILLGPSVFGRVAPGAWGWMFPASSLNAFDVLSTVGLVLFLFAIGTQLDFEHLRQQRRTAAVASATSIGLPLAPALLMVPALKARFGASAAVSATAFWLFLGVSLSITAFPVLARILEEQKLEGTALGTAALMCAALDDVCAWLLLAVALTLLPHTMGREMPIGVRLLWLVGYAVLMLWAVRRAGQWALRKAIRARRVDTGALSYELLGVTMAVVLASAAATEAIGVHPLFGAFVAGVCFPRVKAWQREIRTRLEMTVSVLLMPFFFALTGMRTRLDLLSGVHVWLWTAAIVGLAVLGKVGGAAAAARLMGMPWKSAWALGALLNTRGLVELIVLNIAYNAHVFSPTLFTMLVVMALVTTMMTLPVLTWLGLGIGEGRVEGVLVG